MPHLVGTSLYMFDPFRLFSERLPLHTRQKLWSSRLPALVFLALADMGAELILVDIEEDKCDFFLPEFERFLVSKQQSA
ncbi:hypothetical protein JCM10295v2_002945 [Rhodotorula toruloides]